MTVTVRVEWDMGHRLPNHGGLCRQLHGHRYVADVTLAGPVASVAGQPDEGMVVDFTDAKRAIKEAVAELDHKFMVHADDVLRDRIEGLPGVIFVPFVPTAENIAAALLKAIRGASVNLPAEPVRLRLYETPTSWADAEAEG